LLQYEESLVSSRLSLSAPGSGNHGGGRQSPHNDHREKREISSAYQRQYRGKIEAVLLDWAGTTMDYACMVPAVAFVEVYRCQGVPITMEEARAAGGHFRSSFNWRSSAWPWVLRKGTLTRVPRRGAGLVGRAGRSVHPAAASRSVP
jgi:hypothetical protein